MSEQPAFRPDSEPDATAIISTIADAPEFQEARADGYNISRALARTALGFTGMEAAQLPSDLEDEYEPSTKETNQDNAWYAVAGTLGSFVHGLEGIRHHHETEQLDRSTYRSLKGRAARFNHALKSLIEQQPELSFAAITTMVTDLYGVLNRERWGDDRAGFDAEAAWFQKQLEIRLRGMQQEVVARQVIETINQLGPPQASPRVAVDSHVSVADDLKGKDLYVTLDGVTFPVDIKASERTAAACRKHSRSPQAIITSGIPSRALQGAFQADELSARRAAHGMLHKLTAARNEYLAQQPSTLQTQSKSAS